MEVSARTVRDFLCSAALLHGMSAEKRNRYLFLYERATKTTTALTGMPGGGSSDHEAVLASLADAVGDVGKWKELAAYQRELVRKFIEEAEISDYYKDILMRRYYCGDGWAIILGQIQWDGNVSRRKLFYDHNRALKACADWVNKTGKYKEEMI